MLDRGKVPSMPDRGKVPGVLDRDKVTSVPDKGKTASERCKNLEHTVSRVVLTNGAKEVRCKVAPTKESLEVRTKTMTAEARANWSSTPRTRWRTSRSLPRGQCPR